MGKSGAGQINVPRIYKTGKQMLAAVEFAKKEAEQIVKWPHATLST